MRLLLLFLFSSVTYSQTTVDTNVRAVLTAQQQAWNRGDLTTFMTGYRHRPDTLFVGRTVTRGYEPVLAHYRATYPDMAHMGTLQFAQIEVKPIGTGHAFVLGHFHLDRAKEAGGVADGWFTLLFEKGSDGWKIVADHSSASQ